MLADYGLRYGEADPGTTRFGCYHGIEDSLKISLHNSWAVIRDLDSQYPSVSDIPDRELTYKS